jgi:uncharacterized protein YciI
MNDTSRFLPLSFLAAIALFHVSPGLSDEPASPSFDAELAAELGADALGMRRYVMAFLKAGPDRPDDPERARELQSAHLANIRRMAEQGRLVLAGPFMDDGDIRGIYVFATDDVEQAREWTETDPAVQAGSLVMELHPWYGSAALMKVNDIHERIAKQSF